jgi:inosine-uridine nucleoside N-ribohydrolase
MCCATESVTHMRRPVIVDTDLSTDDCVALLYLLRHPDVDVRAITVVNGMAHVRWGLENVRRLLSLVGRTDIPVAGGPEKPLAGQHAFPASWRIFLDIVPRLMFPRARASAKGPTASELICQQAVAGDGSLAYIGLGPLTNLALALQADPTLAARLDTVVICGGAINVPGGVHEEIHSNPNTVAEWNFYVDPLAADIVFKSGIRPVLIPMDVTHVYGPHPLLFNRDFIDRLAAVARGRASKTMLRLIRFSRLMAPQHPATPVWDAVAAAIAVDPTIGCDWRDLALHIATEPEAVAGQTVVDADKPANARVCLAGDQAAFETAYLTIVTGDEA